MIHIFDVSPDMYFFTWVFITKVPTEEEADRLGETAQEHAGSYVSKHTTDVLLSLLSRHPHISLRGKEEWSYIHQLFTVHIL